MGSVVWSISAIIILPYSYNPTYIHLLYLNFKWHIMAVPSSSFIRFCSIDHHHVVRYMKVNVDLVSMSSLSTTVLIEREKNIFEVDWKTLSFCFCYVFVVGLITNEKDPIHPFRSSLSLSWVFVVWIYLIIETTTFPPRRQHVHLFLQTSIFSFWHTTDHAK